MKILFLVDDLKHGGSQRSAQILINLLSKQNDIELNIVAIGNEWEYSISKKINKLFIYKKTYSGKQKFLLLPFTINKFKKIVRKIKPDYVVSFHQYSNWINVFSQKAFKYKSIVNERHFAEVYYGKKNIIIKHILPRILNKADLVLVNDIEIMESLQRYYKIKSKISVLNNLIDTENISFKINEKKDTSNIIRFITVSRLSHEKNIGDILLAFSKINNKNAVLDIVGDGNESQGLKAQAKELNIEDKIVFHGALKNPFSKMSEADIFVFASLSEGFPNVILEAMYCGLAIISYKFKAGITSILDNGKYGMLIPMGDVDKFAENMQELLNNKKKRLDLSKKSIGRAKDYTDKNKYLKNFLDILKKA